MLRQMEMRKNVNKMENEKLNNREYRSVVELRAKDDSYIVEGYATTFNQPYNLYSYSDYVVNEQVSPRAFDECDMTDVIFQYDHEGRVFARTRNKTLELSCDDKGLKVRADLSGTEEGKKLYDEIKGGYIDRMSFGFVVKTQESTYTDDYDTGVTTVLRTITGISKLYDVSAVSIPANDYTTISARSLGDGLISEIKTERSKRALNILKLKLKLEGERE